MTRYSKIKELQMADIEKQKMSHRCYCGHTIFISKDAEYRICQYCGRKVTKQNKTIYEIAFKNRITNQYKRFLKENGGKINENK